MMDRASAGPRPVKRHLRLVVMEGVYALHMGRMPMSHFQGKPPARLLHNVNFPHVEIPPPIPNLAQTTNTAEGDNLLYANCAKENSEEIIGPLMNKSVHLSIYLLEAACAPSGGALDL